ncbi:alpha/beta fold hydrolase [Phenylobacterium sp.]|uniref:alpha/beta fold hydrolase n=1 Tax=Phenylobacterium sp. TaxID=1871053 RepID=UPI0027336427|nr:alpha/beta hydrolase [Phenylobacterium sp.]MDP3658821.1 alpha/beta hydrolase [Phenylobacterium sp.]
MALTAEGTSRFVQAGDVRIHYHEAGEGPVLIAIHGGAPGAFGWGNFGRNMEALSKHFRTLIVDLPGYGQSDKPPIQGGQYGFYAKIFMAMFDALGIDKAHVVGLATGGGVGIKIALDHPERVDRLVLVSAAGGASMFQPQPSEGMKVIRGYYGGEGPSRDKMRRYLEMMMFDHAMITDELIEERYQASIDPAFMAQAPEGRPGSVPVVEPVWKDLDQIKARTLVIWGRDNRVQGYDNALFMLSRIPEVEVHIYGATGLWVPWERAAAFNREVIGFLTDV